MIPPAFKSLLASEKGVAGGMLIVAATVLVALGRMTVTDWQSFCGWVFTAYVSAKTVQGGIAAFTDAKLGAWQPAAPAAPAPIVVVEAPPEAPEISIVETPAEDFVVDEKTPAIRKRRRAKGGVL